MIGTGFDYRWPNLFWLGFVEPGSTIFVWFNRFLLALFVALHQCFYHHCSEFGQTQVISDNFNPGTVAIGAFLPGNYADYHLQPSS